MFRVIHLNCSNNDLSVVAIDNNTEAVIGAFTAHDACDDGGKEEETWFYKNFYKM